MIKFCSLVFSILLFVTFAIADNLIVFKFTDSELNELKVRKVRGADNKTVYSVGSNENGNYLKAIADNAASGLGKETKVNLNETPFINITCGFHSPSPYTKKSIDNVLSSTKNNLNKWITVKANVKEDFKRFHDLDVNQLDGLAIMSDTDNSKMKSVAYYQNIYFSAN